VDAYGFKAEDVRRIREMLRTVEYGLQNPNVLRAAGPRNVSGSNPARIVRVAGEIDEHFRYPGFVQDYDAAADEWSDGEACLVKNSLPTSPLREDGLYLALKTGQPVGGLSVYTTTCCPPGSYG
jgi:hypothetical protein